SLGLTVFAIILIRILWRFMNTPPELLDTYKKWEKTFATFIHRVLYVVLIALPLSGIIMSIYSKYGIKWFGMPFIKGLDNNAMRELYKEAHEVIGIILLVLIAIHVLGALKHKFIDKDNTMKRMSF
ncbi:MAG: cytochrome b, partial [Methylotenera sp.]|nr:cytochrome b [Methylotenera sp.]